MTNFEINIDKIAKVWFERFMDSSNITNRNIKDNKNYENDKSNKNDIEEDKNISEDILIIDVNNLKVLLNLMYDNMRFGRLFWKKIDLEMIKIFDEINLKEEILENINNILQKDKKRICFETLLEIFEVVMDNVKLERKDFKLLDESLRNFKENEKGDIERKFIEFNNNYVNKIKDIINKDKKIKDLKSKEVNNEEINYPDLNENKENYYISIDVGFNKFFYIPISREFKYNITDKIFIIWQQKFENNKNYLKIKDLTTWIEISNKVIYVKYKDFSGKYKFLELEIVKMEDFSK